MKKFLTLAAGLVLASATAAQAQSCTTATCTVTHTVSAVAPTILKLTLSGLTTTLTAPAADDFDSTAVATAGPTVTLKSNTNAHAQISSSAANWTGTSGGQASKAIGDLEWKVGAGSLAPITATPTDITGLAAGVGNRSSTITWGTLWHSASDTPGNYSLAVTFTLASP